jgi:hypothetical protein
VLLLALGSLGVAQRPAGRLLAIDEPGRTRPARIDRAGAAGSLPARPDTSLDTALVNWLALRHQPDSVVAVLQAALAAGASASEVALAGVRAGGMSYQAANASRQIADYVDALTVLAFATQTHATPDGQFLYGATAYALGVAYPSEAQRLARLGPAERAHVCTAARQAQTALQTAQRQLGADTSYNLRTVHQILGQAGRISPYADLFVERTC